LKSEELKIKEDVIRMTQEKQNLENINIELFEQFKVKSNFIQNIEKNPNELINQVMTFDPDTINKLCLELNNFHNENIYSQMIRMQQYYSQQYYMMQPNNFNN
jgi:hypothetical protein